MSAATLPVPSPEAQAHSAKLVALIAAEIQNHGGWLPFSRYMELALYAPGLGYYTAGARKFGVAGDFITAPELSSLFGRTLARQLVQIMHASSPHILELGAGSGKLALDILSELEVLGALPERYSILEVSADLRQRQQQLIAERLPHLADRVHWLDALPDTISGAVIGNEVLDALPVHLVHWQAATLPSPAGRGSEGEGVHQESGSLDRKSPTPPLPRSEMGQVLLERGISLTESGQLCWRERPITDPALLAAAQRIQVPDDYLSELPLAANGLITSLGQRLQQGALLFIDYGFGAREFYHPQRDRGTLMCHYRHYAHDDALFLPGLQDITAHVDFTAVAEAGVDAGLEFLGYTSQAFFLINCGITDLLNEISPDDVRAYAPLSGQLQKLTSPAEMGELFKVIALGRALEAPLQGFGRGDLSRLL
ncbi:SAM-dependent methyltransferase [Ferriphaselus sp. R-1]|uniref:class I SAM-dependent methyltransferase n=1 Tax=Ferriphaselus sp. R-1 TaxID=1485544 RepID=UPI000553F262|nr:SAM-dependent methyltransferase [Ferriphaselus sp. R-1]